MSIWKLIFGTKQHEPKAELSEKEKQRISDDRASERMAYMTGKDRDPSMMMRFAQENEMETARHLAKMRCDEVQHRRLEQEKAARIAPRSRAAEPPRLAEELAHQKKLANDSEVSDAAKRGRKQGEQSGSQEGLRLRKESDRQLREVQEHQRLQELASQSAGSKASIQIKNEVAEKLELMREKRAKLAADCPAVGPSRGLRR